MLHDAEISEYRNYTVSTPVNVLVLQRVFRRELRVAYQWSNCCRRALELRRPSLKISTLGRHWPFWGFSESVRATQWLFWPRTMFRNIGNWRFSRAFERVIIQVASSRAKTGAVTPQRFPSDAGRKCGYEVSVHAVSKIKTSPP